MFSICCFEISRDYFIEPLRRRRTVGTGRVRGDQRPRPPQGGAYSPAASPVGRAGVRSPVVEHLGHGCTIRGDRLHPRPGSAGVGAASTAAARLGPRGSGHRAGTVALGLSPDAGPCSEPKGPGPWDLFSAG